MLAKCRWYVGRIVLIGLAAGLGLGLGPGRGARADLMIGNLGQSSYDGSIQVSAAHYYTMGFTTSAAETVTSAELALTYSGPSSDLVVGIFADSNGEPNQNALVGYLSASSLTSGSAIDTFTGSLSLAADTTYWLVLGEQPSENTLYWNYTNTEPHTDGVVPAGSGATSVGALLGSLNPMAPWVSDLIQTSYALYDSADPPPPVTSSEPATVVMVGTTAVMGLVVVGLHRRRPKRDSVAEHG